MIRIMALACLFAAALPAQAQQLQGTLFTTADQRARLDVLRQEFLAESREAGFNIEESEVPPLPDDAVATPAQRVEYTLKGILAQRDGSHIIWLNDQSLTERELPAGISLVNEAGRPVLRLETQTGARLLRPGQSVEINSGLVQERYQRVVPPQTEVTDETAQP